MKRLFLSAFAVASLSFCSPLWAQVDAVEDFLNDTSMEDLPPVIEAPKTFVAPTMTEIEVGTTKIKVMDLPPIENPPLKGQPHSLIRWDQDPDEWLDVKPWIADQTLKLGMQDWQIRLREHHNQELVGKILMCKGVCRTFRGVLDSRVEHLSRVLEGDELHVEKDSLAWIYLMDGSLLRVAASSSVSFLEINLSKDLFFIHVRLNDGHVHLSARGNLPELTDKAETDAMALPLLVKEANREFFIRGQFKGKTDLDHLAELQTFDEASNKAQWESIKALKEKNASAVKSKILMVAPNVSLMSQDASFDLAYAPGGQSFFRRRSEGVKLESQARGYATIDWVPVTNDEWFAMDPTGRTLTPGADVPGTVQVLELFTKRIQTLELARELWVDRYTMPITKDLADEKKLAVDHGYTLWKDFTLREKFLDEYTRRIETTNLRSIENLLKKMETNNEVVSRDFTDKHSKSAMNSYLMSLKSRYTEKKLQVRQMTDLQYYAWILKNGKP